MKKLILLVLSLVIFGQSVFAAPAIYYSQTRGDIVASGKVISPNFFSARLDFGDTFKDNAEAQKEYELYASRIRWFPYLNWGALGAFLIYLGSTDEDSYSSGTGLTIFLVPWLAGIFTAANAQGHLNRAINIYNGVPLNDAMLMKFMPSREIAENRGRVPTVGIFQYSF